MTVETTMEPWRRVWRDGLAPQLSIRALQALRDALAEDDPCLIQGGTTTPPPLLSVADWPVEEACLIAYCGWRGEGLKTVAEVEEYFADKCQGVDHLLPGN